MINKTSNSLTTISDCLHWVEEELQNAQVYFGHGTDNAWDEAVHLVLQACELPITSGEEVLNEKVSPIVSEKVKAWLKARITKHTPLPYLTHQAWFMGLPFYVDERVLIPRSPFAEWIENRFRPWINPDKVEQILEIGTGSGCMAIAAAMMFPSAKIDAVDIDAQALNVAKINVERFELQDQVRLVESDCFAALGSARYDVIISNPPYVSNEEMATLPQEYRHEPVVALEAKEHGLKIVKRILQDAGEHLNTNGILMVEVGNSDEALMKALPDVPFTWLEQEHGGHGLFVLTKEELESKNVGWSRP